MRKIALALCVTLLSPLLAWAQEKPGKKEIEKIVEDFILAHPEVIERSMKAYYDKMRENSAQAEFQNALKDRRKVDTAGAPSLGNPSAPVSIVEFSDYQCPYCAKSTAVLQDLRIKYGDKIRLVFKHFPLETHPAARPAAKASAAAGFQGKFWEYHDALMNRQSEWSKSADKESLFIAYADELGLDAEKFLKDYRGDETDIAINKDINQGVKLEVRTTPTYFVNGVPLRGAHDVNYFYKVIDHLLKEKP